MELAPANADPETVSVRLHTHHAPSQRVHFILGMEDEEEEEQKEEEQHHDLFIEMLELSFKDGHEGEWQETARWLKFEEDVEDGGERWSKPFVATLSLHSLFELRRCLERGTVVLDATASTMEELAGAMLDDPAAAAAATAEGAVGVGCVAGDEALRERLLGILLRPPRHQSEKRLSSRIPIVRSIADIGKKYSESQFLDRSGHAALLASPLVDGETRSGVSRENSNVDFSKVDLSFLRKIPPGAEAANVMVGEVDALASPLVAFVRLSQAALIPGLTEVPLPTRFLFLLLGPPVRGGRPYREIGRSIATLLSDEVFHAVAYRAQGRHELLLGIDEFMEQVLVLPPGEWDPSIRIEPPKHLPSQEKRKTSPVTNGTGVGVEPKAPEHSLGPELQRTGRLFGGLVGDVRRKAPWYWSDVRDGTSLQCVASFLFLYCACMSPVITFGGLLGEATDGSISAMESLLGASMTGLAFSIFAGQPLTILGSTGPVLVFEKILFGFCKTQGWSYLSLRACIGLWTAFLCLLLVATDASSLVRYITRFTEEAFAALICVIFIYEALEKLVRLGEEYPVNPRVDLQRLTHYSCACVAPAEPSNETLRLWERHNVTGSAVPWGNLTVSECWRLGGGFVGAACGPGGPYVPDVLLCSVLLFFTTLLLSSFLKRFKTMRYLPTKVRAVVSDFAVFLTIVSMVLVDAMLGIPTAKLHVPSAFKPTRDDRGWIIDPIGPNPWWSSLVAIAPALLCTILIFMDQQITAVIINRKEHKLKKGCGYHLDLLCVAVMLAVCSVMGLPWFVAATVLSISHVNSLRLETESAAPGAQPRFLGVREQRLTGVLIFLLMGCSVFMTSVLKVSTVVRRRRQGRPSPERSKTKVRKVLIRELLFADDPALTAPTEQGLQTLIDHLANACNNFGLTISLKKTNVMGQDDGRIPKDVSYGELASGTRVTGRPVLRFKDVCKRDMKSCDINPNDWEKLPFIPMPVLYGIFMYMGLSSLQGIQFFERLKLYGMPAKHQPDVAYLRHVPLRKVHLFTFIQLACLALLWAVKASPAAVIFPIMT
uniref:Anion exchange protein n=1 Tax=Petromyzon marinus TaxID=7757 RepID=A0AAJ7U7I6_PETMA|nr:electroneutral sodium bicarbonate exchanger 1-like [Petromyzon marinus]